MLPKSRLAPLAALLLATAPHLAQAQTPGVGIGTTAPDASAALDIVSSSKGLLLPRVASAAALANPAPGLLVYQTGAPAGFYYNSGTVAAPAWLRLSPADNLGNHTATQKLDLGTFPLVGGGTTGLTIAGSGAVTTAGALSTGGALAVAGAAKVTGLAGTGTRPVTAAADGTLAAGTYPQLSLSSGTLALTNGGSVVLPDASATNEAQTLTKTGSSVTLSSVGGTGGGTITDDDDQTLSISGSVISISGVTGTGASVTVPSSADNLGNHTATTSLKLGTNALVGSGTTGLTIASSGAVTTAGALSTGGALAVTGTAKVTGLAGTGSRMVTAAADGTLGSSPLPTDAQTLSLSGGTISISGVTGAGASVTVPDASATNELQTISKSGSNVTLSNSGGSFLDADNQTLSISGSTISIAGVTGTGASVTVPSSADNLGNHTATTNLGLNGNWLSNAPGNANGLRVDNAGNVGVGTSTPGQRLEVAGSVFANGENAGFLTDNGTTARVGLLKYASREGGIWRTAGQDLEVGRVDVAALPGSPTAWTTDLYVGGDGRVGIGTTDPAQALDVNGGLRLRGLAGAGNRLPVVQPDGTLGVNAPVYDATATTPLLLLAGTASTGTRPYSVAVAGTRAYVMNVDGRSLQTFDVNSPAAPALLGTAGTNDFPFALAVNGTRAYVVSNGNSTLQLYDVAGAGAPVLLGSVPTNSGPRAVAVNAAGTRAYVAAGGSLATYDVTNPATPVLLGTVSGGSLFFSIALTADGTRAFVADLGSNMLLAFNVSTPNSPQFQGSVFTGSGPRSVAVSGTTAYVVNAGSRTLQVFSVAGAGAPVLLGSATTGNSPNDVAVSGTRAYVVNQGSNALQVFDVATPAVPVLLGSIGTGAAPSHVALNAAGTTAYVVNNDSNTLQVFDTAPGPPRLVAVGADGSLGSVPASTAAAGPGLSSSTSGSTTTIRLGGAALNAATDVPLGGQSLTFSGSGSVGIGTSSPVTTLDVRTADNSAALTVGNTGSGAGAVYFGNANHGLKRNYSTGNDVGLYTTSGNLYLSANNTSTGQFVLQNGGNVGIGTSTPTQKLDVAGNATVSGNTTVGANMGIGTTSPSQKLDVVGNAAISGNTTVGGTAIVGGNVGIGTSAPGQKLDVAGNANVSGSTYVGGSLAFRNSTTEKYNFSLTNGGLNLSESNVAGGRIFVQDGTGNVGIGTTTPGQKLTVAGVFCATGGTNCTSDRRYKREVQPLTGALAKVLALRGVSYYWKQAEFPAMNFSAARQVGIIAQEVEPLYPELVSTGPDGYKSVNYAQLTPVLIEALKEQQQQMEALKARAASAEAKATSAAAKAAAAEAQATQTTATLESLAQRLRVLEAGGGQARK